MPSDTGLTAPPAPDRVPVRLGLLPTSIEEGWRLAQMMAKSELVPKAFRNRPEDILVAIQMGTEIGFAPMQALQSIAVINGRPGVWGDGFLALIMASPHYQDHDEYYEVGGQRRDGLTEPDLKDPTTAAVCTFWRRGKQTPITRRFSVAQAKTAGLLGKDGPWQTHRDRMLQMRARGFAGRDGFPDVLRGISPAEELRDVPMPAIAAAPARIVQRLSTTPPTPSAGPELPPDVIVTGQVHELEQGADGYWLTLRSGERIAIDPTHEADVAELLKFGGTDHTLRVTCRPHPERADRTLTFVTFTLAD